jgi:hypothetical protein
LYGSLDAAATHLSACSRTTCAASQTNVEPTRIKCEDTLASHVHAGW